MCDCHVQIRIELPTDLHEAMRRERKAKGLTLTNIVVRACRAWIDVGGSDARQLPIPGTEATVAGEG